MSDKLKNYVSVSLDDILMDEGQFGKRKSIPRIKFQPGEERILRIIKAPTASKFHIVRMQHWNIPVGAQRTVPQLCSYRHKDEPCYYCEMVNEYFNLDDPRKQQLARKMKANPSFICNVVDINDTHNEDGTPKVQIWQMSMTVFRELKTYFTDKDYGDITHPLTGHDIKVKSEIVGEGANRTWTKYSVRCRAKATELPDLDALDHLIDLEAQYPLIIHDYETQKGIFEGTLDPRKPNSSSSRTLSAAPETKSLPAADDDDFFESEKPAKPVVEAKPEPAPDPISEDDDDDDWDDLDDDGTDEKVADIKKSLKAAIKKGKK